MQNEEKKFIRSMISLEENEIFHETFVAKLIIVLIVKPQF